MKKVSATDIGLFSINTYDSRLSFDNHYGENIERDVDEFTNILIRKDQPIPEVFKTIFDYSHYNQKYVHALGELAFKHTTPLIQKAIENLPFIKGFKFVGGYSPKEYNFEGDDYDIEFDYNIEADSIQNWVKSKDQNELAKYLKKNYSSRDGFISWIPNNIQSLLDEYDSYKILVPVLSFEISKIINEDVDEYEELERCFDMDVINMDFEKYLDEKSLKIFKEFSDIIYEINQ